MPSSGKAFRATRVLLFRLPPPSPSTTRRWRAAAAAGERLLTAARAARLSHGFHALRQLQSDAARCAHRVSPRELRSRCLIHGVGQLALQWRAAKRPWSATASVDEQLVICNRRCAACSRNESSRPLNSAACCAHRVPPRELRSRRLVHDVGKPAPQRRIANRPWSAAASVSEQPVTRNRRCASRTGPSPRTVAAAAVVRQWRDQIPQGDASRLPRSCQHYENMITIYRRCLLQCLLQIPAAQGHLQTLNIPSPAPRSRRRATYDTISKCELTRTRSLTSKAGLGASWRSLACRPAMPERCPRKRALVRV